MAERAGGAVIPFRRCALCGRRITATTVSVRDGDRSYHAACYADASAQLKGQA